MSRSEHTPPAGDGARRAPTPHAEANALVAELVSRARALLADNLVGAYLQGSAATGDFNEYSDIDFVFVVRDDLTDAAAAQLEAMHLDLMTRPNPWATHLEGSYYPAAVLRRQHGHPRDALGAPRGTDWVDPSTGLAGPRVYPVFFLGNGERKLARSEHDNTQVVRWVLREKGVVLDGPDPKTLVDPVAAEALKAEVRQTAERIAAHYLDRGAAVTSLAEQSFLVVMLCRILHTLETGEIRSKAQGAAWAKGRLDPKWGSLIDRAETSWRTPDPIKGGPPNLAEIALTLSFLREMRGRLAPPAAAGGMRAILERQMAMKRGGPPDLGGRPAGGPPRGGGVGHGRPPPPPIRPNGRGKRG